METVYKQLCRFHEIRFTTNDQRSHSLMCNPTRPRRTDMFSSNEMMQGTSGILESPRAVRRISYECARFFPSHIGFLVIFFVQRGNGRQMIPGNCKSGQLPG